MIVRIGFTGTQTGMSNKQKKALRKLLRNTYAIDFHHGDCIGADSEAHEIAKDEFYYVTVHPPTISTKRAFVKLRDGDKNLTPKPYLLRNKDIVNSCDILIAAPKSNREELRSGTWSTIRYARSQNKEVIILEP